MVHLETAAADLYNAVCLNSTELLQEHLENGIDINMDISSALPKYEDAVIRENGRIVGIKEGCIALGPPAQEVCSLTALHLAIILCRKDAENAHSRVEMIRFLLARGANKEAEAFNVAIPEFHFRFGEAAAEVVIPVSREKQSCMGLFCSSFKGFCFGWSPNKEIVDMVETLLLKQSMSRLQEPWPFAKFLLSDELSDVTFECSDGVTLPAHKFALAGWSEFFRSYFNGPWGEKHPDGKWTTEFPSDAIKTMLSFAYTGEVSFQGIKHNQDVMKLAHEWDIPKLFRLAEVKYTHFLSFESLPVMMMEAQLYGAKVLNFRCIKFVKENLAQVVVAHPHFTGTLASDYPELWSELSAELY